VAHYAVILQALLLFLLLWCCFYAMYHSKPASTLLPREGSAAGDSRSVQ
jgi:hypothetical protein